MTTLSIVVGVILLVGGPALAIWMVWIEPYRFRVRRVAVTGSELARRPAEGGLPPGLRILHITDTHFYGRDERRLQFLRRVARQETYDIAVLTGDLVDTPEGIGSCAELARMLEPRTGSYAVLGGHDLYWSPPGVILASLAGTRHVSEAAQIPGEPDRLRKTLEQGGVRVLEDESEVVDTGEGGRIAVVGTQDAQDRTPDYDAAWAGVPAGLPVIALAHCPDAIPEIAARKPDVAFFGHTHGGQVRFPLVGALVTRSTLPAHRASGMSKEGQTLCVLNNGVGTNRYIRFRLLCRPEVGLVTVAG